MSAIPAPVVSIATDYLRDQGDIEPCLEAIAEAGFKCVHWVQHWNDDYIYSASEIRHIRSWFKRLGLVMPDLHATHGVEKQWGSPDEYRRQAGVELVENRMRMTAELGGDVIVLHPFYTALPGGSLDASATGLQVGSMKRSLEELRRCRDETGVRISLENLPGGLQVFQLIDSLLEEYPGDFLGLCYDSGHGNMAPGSLELLERRKQRLMCAHLHDNTGKADQHLLPFSGTVEWPAVMKVIASSSYRKGILLEVSRHACPGMTEPQFLVRARETGEKLLKMAGAGTP